MLRELYCIHDVNADASTEVITASSFKEVTVQLRRSPESSVYKQYAEDFELVFLGTFDTVDGVPFVNAAEKKMSVSFASIFSSNECILEPEV